MSGIKRGSEAASVKGYYAVRKSHSKGKGALYQLVRFHIPKKVGKLKRRSILEAVLAETGADALVEIMASKGGIIRKEMWDFDAILVFDHRTPLRGNNIR